MKSFRSKSTTSTLNYSKGIDKQLSPVSASNGTTAAKFFGERHAQILKAVAVIVAVITVLVTVFVGYLRVSNGSGPLFPGMTLLVSLIILCILSYWLAQSNRPKRLQAGSYIVLVSLAFTVVCSGFIVPIETGTLSAFYVILVLVAALLLTPGEIIGWTLASTIMLTMNYVTTTFILTKRDTIQVPLNVPQATFVFIFFLCLIIISGSSLYYFVNNLFKALANTENQAKALEYFNRDREQKRQFGLEISQNVNTSSLQLAATAQEQSRANSDLAGAVAQVASGMSQINQNALAIAKTTQEIDQAVRDNTQRAGRLSEAVQQAEHASHNGKQAVLETVAAINQVDESIVNLEQKLQDLTQNAAQVNKIVSLINSIANETHLLALNAAIESAGAGEYGLRFGVVAAEVKNLSNRTLQAARDVQKMLGEAQRAIGEAAQAVQEGANQTKSAVQIAGRGGQIVEVLNDVVNRTVEEVHDSIEQRNKIAKMMEQIVGATQEQRSAAREMLLILEEISHSSSHNAAVIRQISSEATSLQQASEHLTLALQN